MQSLDAKPYIVRSSDTLTSIARQFGVSNWKDVNYSPVNVKFRNLRPAPNKTLSGDRLMIPPTPQVVQRVLTERLNNLVRLRARIPKRSISESNAIWTITSGTMMMARGRQTRCHCGGDTG
jgi:hypothetical protein